MPTKPERKPPKSNWLQWTLMVLWLLVIFYMMIGIFMKGVELVEKTSSDDAEILLLTKSLYFWAL